MQLCSFRKLPTRRSETSGSADIGVSKEYVSELLHSLHEYLPPCHDQGFPSVGHELFEQPISEAEFLEIASSYQFEAIQLRTLGACAGDHTITIAENDYTLTRSTGLPCSFNPSGCWKELQ
jgi:hypothetical protein